MRGLSRVAGAEQHQPPTGTRPRAAAPTPSAVRCPGAVQQPSTLPAGQGRAGARASGPAPSAAGGAEGASRGPGGRVGGGGRPRSPHPGSRSPSRSLALRLAEPREAETLSPSMQREEGFNTKMADGPDEYDTETGCVPLLHPEVRDRAERLPGPAAPRPRSLSLSPGGDGRCVRVVTRAGPGEVEEASPGPSAAASG